MLNAFSRSELLLGQESMDKISRARVIVFGIGGVGSYVAEALARTGVGAIDLADSDTVSLTNINRQLIALHSTVGLAKVDVMKSRILDINPDCRVTCHPEFFTREMIETFDFSPYSYIVDAIDTVSAKIALAEAAFRSGVPIISSMGTGNKLDPTLFEVADIYETSVCPLARVMRSELRRRGIPSLKVVYSRETPIVPAAPQGYDPASDGLSAGRRQVPGSLAFVPSAAGLILAGEVLRSIAGTDRT